MTEVLKHEDTAAEALMGEIVDEFLNRVDRGERPQADEYVRRYPQLATVLRQMLPALVLLRGSAADRSAGAADSAEPITPEGPLGDYRLVREVGRGGMGVVYEAVQISLGRRVAVKVLPFASALDAKQLQRFKNEAQAAAQLHHTSIVPVHGVGCDRGVHYYAMQFIEGQTLAQMIADLRLQIADFNEKANDAHATGAYTPGPEPAICNLQSAICNPTMAALSTERSTKNPAFFRTAANLGVRAAEALEHAHGEGVVHRDIKPANLMVDGKGNLWVTDFGLAHCQSQAGLTMTGDLVGTLRYMSPEQALAQRVVIDHRTDIYSLGATLYELLTLQPVFSGRDRQELLRQIAFEEPRPPRRLNKAIPAELETIVLKALEKNPADRYATAQELADDLERFLKDEPIRAKRPSPLQRARKWTRRHKTVAWSATVATMLVLIVAVTALAVSNGVIAQEKKQTEEALRAETDAKNDLVQALEREARASYFRSIQLADRELSSNNVGRAEELLDGCLVALRGWEWHYLKRRHYQEPVTFRGHRDWVCGVAFSPNGKCAVSGSAISLLVGDLIVWDPATGKVIRTLPGHVGPIAGVAFSADGKCLASGGWDRTVRVWDGSTWQARHTLRGHTEYVACVACSPDGRLVASGSGDRAVKVWDAATGQEVRSLRGHTGGLACVAFSPDGRQLASASSDETVRIWDVATGQEQHTLRGHNGTVLGLAYSRDGARLASAGFDGIVKVWDATTGRPAWSIRADLLFAWSVAFSRDGTRLAVGSWDKTVKLWDLETGQEVLSLRGHTDMVSGLAFSQDGRLLASASLDGSVKVWDATPWNGVGGESRVLRGHGDAVLAVLFSPDGKRLASTGYDGTVKVWDPHTGEEVLSLRGEAGPAFNLSFSRDSGRLASASIGRVVKLWDVAAGKELATFPGNLGSACLSPDGRRLAWSREGGDVEVRDTETGREVLLFHTHPAPVISVFYSPDGKRMVTASWDKTAKVWDASNGAELLTLRGHTHVVQMGVFSQDGQRLATSSWDNTARIWDAASGKELFTLRGHGERVGSVAFSPDSKYLATASYDHTVKIWEVKTGKELLTLAAHTGYVASVAFSPDGKRLATAGGYRGRGEIKIWDATLWEGKPSDK